MREDGDRSRHSFVLISNAVVSDGKPLYNVGLIDFIELREFSMTCFNRIIVWTLILCLSRTPLPWGHSHYGLDAEQLASHLRTYHPATSECDLPKGWHWHLTQFEVFTDGDTLDRHAALLTEGSDAFDVSQSASDAAVFSFTDKYRPDCLAPMNLASAQAEWHQQTYLRLSVLLI